MNNRLKLFNLVIILALAMALFLGLNASVARAGDGCRNEYFNFYQFNIGSVPACPINTSLDSICKYNPTNPNTVAQCESWCAERREFYQDRTWYHDDVEVPVTVPDCGVSLSSVVGLPPQAVECKRDPNSPSDFTGNCMVRASCYVKVCDVNHGGGGGWGTLPPEYGPGASFLMEIHKEISMQSLRSFEGVPDVLAASQKFFGLLNDARPLVSNLQPINSSARAAVFSVAFAQNEQIAGDIQKAEELRKQLIRLLEALISELKAILKIGPLADLSVAQKLLTNTQNVAEKFFEELKKLFPTSFKKPNLFQRAFNAVSETVGGIFRARPDGNVPQVVNVALRPTVDCYKNNPGSPCYGRNTGESCDIDDPFKSCEDTNHDGLCMCTTVIARSTTSAFNEIITGPFNAILNFFQNLAFTITGNFKINVLILQDGKVVYTGEQQKNAKKPTKVVFRAPEDPLEDEKLAEATIKIEFGNGGGALNAIVPADLAKNLGIRKGIFLSPEGIGPLPPSQPVSNDVFDKLVQARLDACEEALEEAEAQGKRNCKVIPPEPFPEPSGSGMPDGCHRLAGNIPECHCAVTCPAE